MKKRIQTLERTLHEEVPLTRQMGIRVEDHDGRELVIKADFEPNINIHGTAFGGSLFSICAITCWGLLHLKFEEAGVEARSVLGKAGINYLRPVRGEIEAHCRLPDDGSFESFMALVKEKRKASLQLRAVVLSSGRELVQFQGDYSVYYPQQPVGRSRSLSDLG